MIGSGGTSPWRDFYPDVGTGGANVVTYLVWGQNWPAAGENPLRTPADKLAFIRSTLGFNISQLASAVGVERPTIYAWLDSRSEPHPGNAARLDAICGLAAKWVRLSNMPLTSTLREKGARAEDVLILVEKSPFDESAVVAKFEELAGVPRARRLGVRAAALRRGVNLEGVKQRDDELEALTGRRGSPE
jgi:transcriptional regulator with XRE-family HTH domain